MFFVLAFLFSLYVFFVGGLCQRCSLSFDFVRVPMQLHGGDARFRSECCGHGSVFFLLPIRLRRSVFSARGCCRSLSFIRRRWFAESFRVWIVRDFVDWFHPLKKGKFIFTFASLHLPFLLCCLFRSTISLQHLFLLLRPPFPCFLCSFFSLLRKKVDSYRVPFDFGTRSNYIRELSDIVQATSG